MKRGQIRKKEGLNCVFEKRPNTRDFDVDISLQYSLEKNVEMNIPYTQRISIYKPSMCTMKCLRLLFVKPSILIICPKKTYQTKRTKQGVFVCSIR